METGAMLTLHLLIVTTLCQMEHIKTASCWSAHGPKHVTGLTSSSLGGGLATCPLPMLCMKSC